MTPSLSNSTIAIIAQSWQTMQSYRAGLSAGADRVLAQRGANRLRDGGSAAAVITDMLFDHARTVACLPPIQAIQETRGRHRARGITDAHYSGFGSRNELVALRTELEIDYEQRSRGTLQLFRNARQVDASVKDIDVLRSYGVPFEVLDRDGCVRAEPGLADSSERIAGGLRLPNDETGDCHLFSVRLAEHLARAGVESCYDTSVLALEASGGAITGVRTDRGVINGDAYVVALGSHSPTVMRPLGVRLPVYPVKGYSITMPVTDARRAPVSTLLDETFKIAITRLGDRIRVGGMAEISGYDQSLPARREATLLYSLNDLFPRATRSGETSFWGGLRPMTPDGTPVIGPTPLSNLYLNTGHGTLGWTMACGSAAVIAAIVSRDRPPIEISGLGLERFS